MPEPSHYDVFLSHNGDDKLAVEELAPRLKRENVQPWLDIWHLRPGEPWQPAVEQALADSAHCAVFIGPSGIGPWQHEEMRAAISRRIGSGGGFRVIPVLLPGGRRDERTRLPTFLTAATWVEFQSNLDEPDAFRRLVCGIRGTEPGPGPDGAIFAGKCPYRGLEAFHAEDRPFFFGREALTEWLLEALRRPRGGSQDNRFLAIIGPSGSGKSSLALAGLVPAVQQGKLEGSADWKRVIFRPGANPLESLTVALAHAGVIENSTATLASLEKEMLQEECTLHRQVRLYLHETPPSRRLFLLVDQFEEIFTLCTNKNWRRAAIDNLHYAAGVPGGQTLVVLTLRADFYGKCAAYQNLAAALSEHQVLVGPLSVDELPRAIEKPAQLVGCEFEPGLVDTLIRDVRNQAGALPLLQYALLELWKRRRGRKLTAEDYQAIGRLEGALDQRANAILSGFSPDEKELCRRIFLRLTQPGEGTEDTKRRVSLRELFTADADVSVMQGVVNRLADERLITTESEEQIEVAHEALIRGWSALRHWIETDRAGLRTHRRLGEAAREWETSGKEASFLYRGARLAVVKEWEHSHPKDPNQLERDFLATSGQAEQQQHADELAAARRLAEEAERARKAEEEKARHQRETSKKLRRRARVLAVLALVTLGLLAVGVYKWWEADQQRDIAKSANITLMKRNTELEESQKVNRFELYLNNISLAEREWRANRIKKARKLLEDCPKDLRGWEWDYLEWLFEPKGSSINQDGAISAVGFCEQGKVVSVCKGAAGQPGKVFVWDPGARTSQQFELPPGKVRCARFSANGKRLAVSFENQKTVAVLDVNVDDGKLKARGVVDADDVHALALSSDGNLLAVARDSRANSPDSGFATITITDLSTHSFSTIFRSAVNGDEISDLALSLRGDRLAWSGKINGGFGAFEVLTVSYRGQDIAAALAYMALPLGQGPLSSMIALHSQFVQLRPLFREERSDRVRAVALSPDGKKAAWGGDDLVITLADIENREIKRLLGHTRPIVSLAISGSLLASGAEDQTVKVWDLVEGDEFLTLRDHTKAVTCLAFGTNGSQLASGSLDETLKCWNTEGNRPLRIRRLPCIALDFALFARAEWGWSRLASVDAKSLLIWDRTQIFPTSAPGERCVAFSPDGNRLATARSKNLIIYDVSNPMEDPAELPKKTLPGHKGKVNALAYSPDGKTLASGGEGMEDYCVRVWDTATGKQLHCFNGHTGPVTTLVFSPNGRRIVSGGLDKTIRVWEITDGAQVINSFATGYSVRKIAMSKDGQWIAAACGDRDDGGQLKIWRADTGAEVDHPPQKSAYPLRWVGFTWHGKLRIAATGDDGTLTLWDVPTGRQVLTLDESTGSVCAWAFGPNGKALATGDSQGRIKIYNNRAR